MSTSEWNTAHERYKDVSTVAIDLRREIKLKEIERSQYMADGVRKLIGTENSDTNKPHSRTSAEKWVHDNSEPYLAMKRQIVEFEHQADGAELEARALWLLLRHWTAIKEGMPT
jgi:hypothetical protein